MATNKGDFVLSVVGRMVGQQSQPQRKARPMQPARTVESTVLEKMTQEDWRAFRHIKAGVTIARQRQQQRKATEAARLYSELVALEKGLGK